MAIGAFGGKFYYSSNGSAFTEITLVREVQPPQMTRATARGDTLASANHARVKHQSWIDGGQATFQLEYTGTIWNTLLGTHFVDTPATQAGGYYWRVEDQRTAAQATTGDYHVWRGHLSALSKTPLNTEDDDTQLINGTIDVTGLPTYTAGA